MNKFWNIYRIIFSVENLIASAFSVIAGFATFGKSFYSPDKNQIMIILAMLGVSIAYSSFFISNVEKIINKNKQKLVLNISKVLVVLPFFPVFSIMTANVELDFGNFNVIVAWTITTLSLLSIVIFYFCFTKLLIILLTSLFGKK